jgi:tetratricopeptide (TPR) repeat protein
MKQLILLLVFFSFILTSFSQNSEFRSYLGYEKNNFTSSEKSNAAFNKGIDYLNNGDYNSAIKQFTITIEEDEKESYLSTDAYLMRASALIQLNSFQIAIDDYSIIINNEKNQELLSTAYIGRGGVYGYLNDFTKGINDFNRALKINPNDVDAIYNLARLYIQKKDYKEGLAALYLAEKEYNTQALDNSLTISSILYMKGVAKYTLKYSDYCKDFISSMKYKNSLVKEQIDFIEKNCRN